jgi:hypothetical protein
MLLYRKTAELKARPPRRLHLQRHLSRPRVHVPMHVPKRSDAHSPHARAHAPAHAVQAQAVAEYVEELLDNGAGKFLLFAHHKVRQKERKKERPTPVSRRALRGTQSMRTTDALRPEVRDVNDPRRAAHRCTCACSYDGAGEVLLLA